MILCDKRKLGIFLVPRTGTTSISKYFEKYDFVINDHDHTTFKELDIPDKEEYQFFAFYRDPAERFLSGMRLLTIMARLKPEIDPGTNDPMEYLSRMKDRKIHIIFEPQTKWLDHPNITCLDYRNFEKNFSMLCNKFDVQVPAEIPRHNRTYDLPLKKTGKDFDSLIHSVYADDYAFFENKGLTF